MIRFNPPAWIAFTSLLVLATAMPDRAAAQEPAAAARINAANELVRIGKVTEAIDAYSGISAAAGTRETLEYNLGVAHYRNGDLDAAATLFTGVAGSADRQLASRSQFNLGNCHYSRALQLAEQDRPAAIANLRDAISNYRSSLHGDPDNADARVNIELAAQLLRDLENEPSPPEEQESENQPQDNPQEQNQQEQDQSEQDQQEQDQSEQDQEQQGQQSGDRQEGADSENADSENAENDKQSGRDSKGPESQPSPSPDSQGGEQDDSKDPSRESADQPGQPENENPSSPAANPDGELTAANQRDQASQGGSARAAPAPNQKEGSMTVQEALKMLQSVRDRDMLRRMRQQQQERSRRVPVERDW